MCISNNAFSNDEKILLAFILKQEFKEKSRAVQYINTLTTDDIIRDDSPYYKIIKFRTKHISEECSGMSPMICIQVIHSDGTPPTVFTLYEKDGYPFEYEIYNADSSEIDITKIFAGEIYSEA